MTILHRQKALLLYLARFLGTFFLLFYGTEAIIALSSPGGLYSPFVEAHLNFIDPFRHFLLSSARMLLSVFQVKTYFQDSFTITLEGGKGVKMVYSCIGYGVLSFWTAFVFADRVSWKRKVAWVVGGCFALCALNIARISLILVAYNKAWPIPFGWDHHTWFNIVAYSLIFGMMYIYDRKTWQKREKSTPGKKVVRKGLSDAYPQELTDRTSNRFVIPK